MGGSMNIIEHSRPSWLAHAHVLRGWLRSVRGDTTVGFSFVENRLKENRKGAEVGFARETRGSNLRRISSRKKRAG
jgi:hypothetical protein